MTSSPLDNLKVVLFETQDVVNVAGTVRAMKNMGVSSLRLVRPAEYNPNFVQQVAHGTHDVAAGIRHFESLDEALADCVRVAGFTARRRAANRAVADPEQAAAHLLEYAAHGTVAVLFGREDDGLPNDALDRCHIAVTIPTTEHPSLNLAQAVLVALYELHLAAGDATRALAPPRKKTRPPTTEETEMVLVDVERGLDALDFFKTRNSEHVMRSVRSLLARAEPDQRELMLVRAMAIEILRTLGRVERRHAEALAALERELRGRGP